MIISHNWTTTQPDNPAKDVSARNLNDHVFTPEADDYTWDQIDKSVSSIADIVSKSHSLLTDVGSNSHATIDTHLEKSNLDAHGGISNASIEVNGSPNITLTGSINQTTIETVTLTGTVNTNNVVSTPLTGSADPSATATLATLTGTSTSTNGLKTVVGVGSLYLSELQVGERVKINGEVKIVDSVTDDLNFTVTANFTTSGTDAAATKVTSSLTLIGVDTLFTLELVVGDRLRVNSTIKTITSIISDTQLTTDAAFVGTNDNSLEKISSLVTLVGTGTFFTLELIVGDYIKYGPATYKKVVSIISDTVLTVDVFASATVDSPLYKYNNASGDIVGVGTLFTSQLAVSDTISVNGDIRKVMAIKSDTILTPDTALTTFGTDSSPKKISDIFCAKDATGVEVICLSSAGLESPKTFAIGTVNDGLSIFKAKGTVFVSGVGNSGVLSEITIDTTAPGFGQIGNAFGITSTVVGNGTLPQVSGMDFLLKQNTTSAWGSSLGTISPHLIGGQYQSLAGSASMGSWISVFQSKVPSFAGGFPTTYVGYEAFNAAQLSGMTSYGYWNFGNDWGMGFDGTQRLGSIWIKNNNAAGNVLFGSNGNANIWSDGSDLMIDADSYASNTGKINMFGDTNILDPRAASTERVTNGGFTTDLSSWIMNATTNGWNWVSGGKVGHIGSGTGTLTQTITGLTVGTVYRYSIDKTGFTAGSCGHSFAGKTFPTMYYDGTNKTYVYYVRATSTSGTITLTPAATFRGNIDNISVKAVSGGAFTAGSIAVGGSGSGILGGSGMSGQAVVDVDDNNPLKVCLATRRSENTTVSLGSQVYFGRQRGTLAVPASVQSGDKLLDLYGYGYDGTDYAYATAIRFSVEGTIAANQLPGVITFETADSTGALTEILRIDSTGSIIASGPTSTFRAKGYTVATLPAGVQGDMVFVTDASAPAFHVAVTGGGSVIVPVFFDGTNWITH